MGEYVVRFRSTDPSAQDEYYLGETRQRGGCIYAITTPIIFSKLKDVKIYTRLNMAQYSADSLNRKCANRGMFEAVSLEDIANNK